MQTYEQTLTFVVVACSECGISYGLPSNYARDKRENGGTFRCPNGHLQCYGTTEVQRLEKQLAAERARLDQAKADANWQRKQRAATERRLSAARGVTTRLKNRVSKGVCPYCNRTFENLGRHMASKHPTFAASEE